MITISQRIRKAAICTDPKFDGACLGDWDIWLGLHAFETVRRMWEYKDCSVTERRMFLLFIAEALA